MKLSGLVILILTGALLTQSSCQKPQAVNNAPAKPNNNYLTTLRLNAVEGVSDEEVIDMVERYSKAIIELGYPELTYKLWKIYDESPAKVQMYLIEGNWPDRKVWEDIHLHEKYKGVSETFQGKFPTKDGEMVHYTLLKDRLK